MILDPEIVYGLQILADRARRLSDADLPDAPRAKQRQAIIDAAYLGNGEQQASMRVARQTGDAAAIGLQSEAGLQRVAAALGAYDAVFGGDRVPDDQTGRGGLPMRSSGVAE